MTILLHDDPQEPTVLDEGMVALATRRGLAYEETGKSNQDRVASDFVDGVWVDMVADGLGGYADGAQAAQLLTENLQANVEDMLKATLQSYKSAGLMPPSGTTLVHARLDETSLQISHIGDSRALLFAADGSFLWQSQDHKPPTFEHRFRLTRYVHPMDEAQLLEQLSRQSFDLREIDQELILVLASDGITDNLKTSVERAECHPQVSQIIEENPDPAEICQAIMEEANRRMALKGTEEGEDLDVKPDNSACLVRKIYARTQK